MKNIIISILVVLMVLSKAAVYGQEPSIQERVTHSTLVIEGRVIGKECFKHKNMIYTSYTVKPICLFKGENKGENIALIVIGGELNNESLAPSHVLVLSVGDEGFFFCNESSIKKEGMASFSAFKGERGVIKKYYDEYNLPARGYLNAYKNLEKEIYQPIEKYCGQQRRNLNNSYEQEKLIEWLEKKHEISSTEGKYGVIFKFDNPQITGIGTQYLEFDIKIASVVGSYELGSTEIFIDYDVTAFGTNIVGSANIVGNKETAILSTDYTLSLSDSTTSKLKISSVAALVPNNLYTLTTNYEKFCHLKLDISSLLSLSPHITFDELLMQDRTQYYDSGSYYDFPFVIAEDSITAQWSTLLSPIIIESLPIYPGYVTAGTFDTIYIKGYNFGTFSGEVYFETDSLFGYTKTEQEDLIWTDTLIKVNVFSNNLWKHVAGTSKVIVETISGDSAISPNTVYVEYAITNYREPTTRRQILTTLADFDADSTFTFYLNKEIGLYSDTAAIIRKVINQWKCETGINFVVADSLVDKPIDGDLDGYNVISFGYAQGAHGITLAYADNCSDNAVDYRYTYEIDMIFDENDLWYFDTTSTNIPITHMDLWSIELHEMGHAHKINHVLDLDKVMFFAQTEGETLRQLHAMDIAAGNWIMDSIATGRANCPSIVKRVNCGGVNEIVSPAYDFSFSLFPNPTEGKLNLSFLSKVSNVNYRISVVNYLGQAVFISSGKVEQGRNNLTLDLQQINLNTGVYLLKLEVDKLGQSNQKIQIW